MANAFLTCRYDTAARNFSEAIIPQALGINRSYLGPVLQLKHGGVLVNSGAVSAQVMPDMFNLY